MKLTRRQEQVLANSLSWCEDGFVPSEKEIADFFSHNDKGTPLRTYGGFVLQAGWTSYYGSPFDLIAKWEAGEAGAPSLPPAVWVYDFLFNPDKSFWFGWRIIFLDWFHDYFTGNVPWERHRPAFEQTCALAGLTMGVRKTLPRNGKGV